MRYLPLHFDLKDRPVLVVGGGEIAERKINLLLKADPQITLVAPEVSASIREKLLPPHVIHEERYNHSHLEGKVLVVAATNDESLHEDIYNRATEQNILVNVVDSPELCTVTFPAIVDRDPIVISIGSGGGSPVLVRRIRTWIETIVPERISALAKYLTDRRSKLKELMPDIDVRRRHTEAFLESPGSEAALQGDLEAADQALFASPETQALGEVYLVGAGPGDPDLLTLRALQLMQQAEVVLYDNLVSPRILDRTRRDADREFVGKRSGYKSISQEDINDLLVRLALDGKRVLRLKGGDPFIFGRGGEEITALVHHNIPFQVVPGITAANGCAAYAGIPLTHRDYARSVRFVTGHPKDGKVDLPWQDYGDELETIVFYMGLGGLATICQQLIQHGRDSTTPVAIVSKGTTPEQRVLKGTLETIPGLVARTQIQTPTIIIVGKVITFAESI